MENDVVIFHFLFLIFNILFHLPYPIFYIHRV
jgi:hypothetical protein